MPIPRECLNDNRIEQIVAVILRAGVMAAAAVVLAGGLCYLARHGTELPHYGVFRGEGSELTTVGGVISSAKGGSCRGIIQLGLLLLIATPVLRVLFTVAAFAIQRDRMYTLIALFVLGVLMFSLSGHKF